MEIKGAGDHTLPYKGYIEISLHIPSQGKYAEHHALALVVPQTTYHSRAPVLIGTNVMQMCYSASEQSFGHDLCKWPVSPSWRHVYQQFVQLNHTVYQTVHCNASQQIPANSKVLIPCKMQTGDLPHKVTVMTESGDISLPAGLLLSTTVMDLHAGIDIHDVSVYVSNVSGREVTIPANTPLCLIQQVSSLHSKNVLADATENDNFPTMFELDNLPPEVSSDAVTQLQSILLKWKSVFYKGSWNLGKTDLVKHSFKMTDDTPLKQRHRWILPAMLDEVKQHLEDMLC